MRREESSLAEGQAGGEPGVLAQAGLPWSPLCAAATGHVGELIWAGKGQGRPGQVQLFSEKGPGEETSMFMAVVLKSCSLTATLTWICVLGQVHGPWLLKVKGWPEHS